jgi:hypothetical protein
MPHYAQKARFRTKEGARGRVARSVERERKPVARGENAVLPVSGWLQDLLARDLEHGE